MCHVLSSAADIADWPYKQYELDTPGPLYIYNGPSNLKELECINLNGARIFFNGPYDLRDLRNVNLVGATVFMNGQSMVFLFCRPDRCYGSQSSARLQTSYLLRRLQAALDLDFDPAPPPLLGITAIVTLRAFETTTSDLEHRLGVFSAEIGCTVQKVLTRP